MEIVTFFSIESYFRKYFIYMTPINRLSSPLLSIKRPETFRILCHLKVLPVKISLKSTKSNMLECTLMWKLYQRVVIRI